MKLGIVGVTAVTAVLAWCASEHAAADVQATADVAAAPVLDDRYPRAAVPFGSDVLSYPDLIYSTPAGFRPLRLDLYRPAASGERPLVIYIHGGGWQGGHTRHAGAFENWPGVLASLAARGYVVASIEYRLSGEAKFPAAIQDVKTAIRWLRSESKEFGIDGQRVILWGGSAGGQLAALAATSCGIQSLNPEFVSQAAAQPSPSAALAAQSDCVQGLVAWYGVFDFATIPELASAKGDRKESSNSPVGKYLGCIPSQCAEAVAWSSPVSYLDAHDPPTLLIHGEVDKVVPVEQSRAFYAALQTKGIPAQLLVIPGVDHSFIGGSPEQTREASLAALTRTFAFIDATTGGKRQ